MACVAGACQLGAPPALHWRLDEASGTMAMDGSGGGWHGTYAGASGAPAPSPLVPTVQFANPASRAFTMASRHAIELPAMPAALKPANNLTVSVWFRATQVDTSGSELVSGGNQYLLRIGVSSLRFSRRVVGTSTSVPCDAPVTGHLDGKWHHVAGVQSTAGMKLYLDGTERCTNTRGEDLRYDGDPGLWIGRHSESASYDFDGNLDEVRIYTRALTAGRSGPWRWGPTSLVPRGRRVRDGRCEDRGSPGSRSGWRPR
jgi:hypothetical protein